jgi:hypothetical protein
LPRLTRPGTRHLPFFNSLRSDSQRSDSQRSDGIRLAPSASIDLSKLPKDRWQLVQISVPDSHFFKGTQIFTNYHQNHVRLKLLPRVFPLTLSQARIDRYPLPAPR